ncbi:hypothetical protein DACRYDRAFT_54221, partial [Dacryopinax primogenitus]
FGAYLGPEHGKLLFRGELNSDLYGPLQTEYEKGKLAGTDVWIHKDRMSGIWGRNTPLEEHLTKHNIKTLFWSGVNADQCVLGSVVDAYSLGYDIVAVEDTIATTSPTGAKENLMYNSIRVGHVLVQARILFSAPYALCLRELIWMEIANTPCAAHQNIKYTTRTPISVTIYE